MVWFLGCGVDGRDGASDSTAVGGGVENGNDVSIPLLPGIDVDLQTDLKDRTPLRQASARHQLVFLDRKCCRCCNFLIISVNNQLT